jgi:hypothetical protein
MRYLTGLDMAKTKTKRSKTSAPTKKSLHILDLEGIQKRIEGTKKNSWYPERDSSWVATTLPLLVREIIRLREQIAMGAICGLCNGAGGWVGFGGTNYDQPQELDCPGCAGVGRIGYDQDKDYLDILREELVGIRALLRTLRRYVMEWDYDDKCPECVVPHTEDHEEDCELHRTIELYDRWTHYTEQIATYPNMPHWAKPTTDHA